MANLGFNFTPANGSLNRVTMTWSYVSLHIWNRAVWFLLTRMVEVKDPFKIRDLEEPAKSSMSSMSQESSKQNQLTG